MKKEKLIDEIKQKILSATNAPLYKYRTQHHYHPVIGEGNVNAYIMFVGEAPGKNEALTGRPFAGAAGRVLDSLLLENGIRREEVYITNIVNDRPPENRDPNPTEINFYSPFLFQQIEIIHPQIIATLGRFSMKYILTKFDVSEKEEPIGKLHGKIFQAKASYGAIKIVPLYHPAATLYSGKTKELLKEDMKNLGKLKKFESV